MHTRSTWDSNVVVELQVGWALNHGLTGWILFSCVPPFYLPLNRPSSRPAAFPESNPAKLLISSSHPPFFFFYHPLDICTEGVKWSHLSVCQRERSLAGEEGAGSTRGRTLKSCFWSDRTLIVFRRIPGFFPRLIHSRDDEGFQQKLNLYNGDWLMLTQKLAQMRK